MASLELAPKRPLSSIYADTPAALRGDTFLRVLMLPVIVVFRVFLLILFHDAEASLRLERRASARACTKQAHIPCAPLLYFASKIRKRERKRRVGPRYTMGCRAFSGRGDAALALVCAERAPRGIIEPPPPRIRPPSRHAESHGAARTHDFTITGRAACLFTLESLWRAGELATRARHAR